MPRDSYASLRLPADLKSEVQRIALEEQRSLSMTIEFLLRRGVQAFNRDGVLLDRPDSPKAQRSSRAAQTNTELSTVEVMAEQILEAALKKARERKSRGGGERPRKKSSKSRVA